MNLLKNSLESKERIINNHNNDNLTRYRINYTYGGSKSSKKKNLKNLILMVRNLIH